jgi:hypothetical protein
MFNVNAPINKKCPSILDFIEEGASQIKIFFKNTKQHLLKSSGRDISISGRGEEFSEPGSASSVELLLLLPKSFFIVFIFECLMRSSENFLTHHFLKNNITDK